MIKLRKKTTAILLIATFILSMFAVAIPVSAQEIPQIITYDLELTIVGSGTVVIMKVGQDDPVGTYDGPLDPLIITITNEETAPACNIQATPQANWKFTGWSGEGFGDLVGGVGDMMVFTLDQNMAITATFEVMSFGDETQSVTGSTLSAYTVTTMIDFVSMPPSSTKEHTGIITATYDATIDVTVDNTLVDCKTGRITSLEYFVGAESKCLITAPIGDGVGGIYTVTGSPFSVTSGQSLDLTATTGTESGVWDPVVITLTITPN